MLESAHVSKPPSGAGQVHREEKLILCHEPEQKMTYRPETSTVAHRILPRGDSSIGGKQTANDSWTMPRASDAAFAWHQVDLRKPLKAHACGTKWRVRISPQGFERVAQTMKSSVGDMLQSVVRVRHAIRTRRVGPHPSFVIT